MFLIEELDFLTIQHSVAKKQRFFFVFFFQHFWVGTPNSYKNIFCYMQEDFF